MSVASRQLVEGFYELTGGEVAELSGERMVELGELLGGHVTEDFECVMVGPPGVGAERHPGLAGFAGAWREWVSPYTRFSVELVDVIELEDAVLLDVRQRGRTRHDGVEIENASGSLWRFRGELLERVEFYLDRDAAFEAAGLDPDA
jgi:ketosteroid isomerase-like protein